MNLRRAALCAAVAGATLVPALAAAQTLAAVKQRGALICGVSEGLIGFSEQDGGGKWTGFDVDLCRAVAAALFDDPDKVRFVPLDTRRRFQALGAGEIDVLSRNSTWTISREMPLKLNFAGVTYYDGQGFMVRKSLQVDTALALDGKVVCVQADTTTLLNAGDYFRSNKMNFQHLAFATAAETTAAYDAGRCDVFTADSSQLNAQRLKLGKPEDHVILPEIISKEPLGPAVRQGDDQWFNIVKWTHFAMLNAEELGVGMATLDQALKSEKPDVRRLLGLEGEYGEQLGLTRDWAVRIVRHVGNYADVFERNVGGRSRLKVPRGINHLWSNGGIQYAPPIR